MINIDRLVAPAVHTKTTATSHLYQCVMYDGECLRFWLPSSPHVRDGISGLPDVGCALSEIPLRLWR